MCLPIFVFLLKAVGRIPKVLIQGAKICTPSKNLKKRLILAAWEFQIYVRIRESSKLIFVKKREWKTRYNGIHFCGGRYNLRTSKD